MLNKFGKRSMRTGCTVLFVVLLSPLASQGQVSVTTQHNDNWRTGQNTNETHLTTAISKNSFGLLCKVALSSSPQQEQVYAQPLVIGNSNGSMTIYVATMQDKVYAFTIPANWNGHWGLARGLARPNP